MRFNRNGTWISIVHAIDSDPSRPIDIDRFEPIIRMSLIELENLKAREPDLNTRFHIDGQNRYRIKSEFGRDEIFIDAKVVLGEEEVVGKEIHEMYRFVPAIVLTNDTTIMGAYNTYVYRWQSTGNNSVCYDQDWNGLTGIVQDAYLGADEDEVGVRHTDAVFGPDTEVIGLTNWGDRSIWWWEDYEVVQDDESDGEWSPLPYYGWDNAGASMDHLLHKLDGMGTGLYYLIIACFGSSCDDPFDYNDACGHCALCYLFDDGYCVEYSGGCCQKAYENTILYGGTTCGGRDWIMGNHWATGIQCYKEGNWTWVMGLCLGGWNCVSCETQNYVPFTTIGSPQDRTATYDYEEIYPWYSMETYNPTKYPLYRSAGSIIFDVFNTRFEQHISRAAHVTAPCESNQTDTVNEVTKYDNWYGSYQGAYVRDTGPDPGAICTNPKLHDDWFCITQNIVYDNNYTVNCSPMQNAPYRDYAWVYHQGGIGPCPDHPPESWYNVIEAYVEGEVYELDRMDPRVSGGSEPQVEFHIGDCQILDFLGTPVYMYSFCRLEYYGVPGTTYEAIYTQYGYFLNGEHHYKRFYPAGIPCSYYGNTTCLHDVEGSSRDGWYGFGQLAGYIVKEKKEMTINA